jgi:hypothetical protein
LSACAKDELAHGALADSELACGRSGGAAVNAHRHERIVLGIGQMGDGDKDVASDRGLLKLLGRRVVASERFGQL